VATPGLDDMVVADIADGESVRAAIAGVEAVVHLAAQPVDAPFDQVVGPNVIGLYNVVEAAREAAVRRLVLTSSVMVVSGRKRDGGATGAGEASPRSHYALSKLYAEQMGEMYARCYGMSVLAVRLGWVVRNLDEARHMVRLAIPDIYLSRADAGRFYAAALAAREITFSVVYATSKGGHNFYDMEPARRLLGYEPRDRWPEGLPFAVPTTDGA
jgi:uronate dehydrogenase